MGINTKNISTAYIVIIFLFPLLYFVNSITPWANGLWGYNDRSFYFPFWTSTIILHWFCVGLIFIFLKKSKLTLADIGLSLSRTGWILFIGGIILAGLGIFAFTEMGLSQVSLDNSKLIKAGNFLPITTGQRLFWIFCAITAGFCEELAYRGFCIKTLEIKGWNKWLACLIATLPFILIHGPSAISTPNLLVGYFIFGLIMGLIFLLTKRIWIIMTLHIVFDLFVMMQIFQYTNQ